jgi:hypothetical protein
MVKSEKREQKKSRKEKFIYFSKEYPWVYLLIAFIILAPWCGSMMRDSDNQDHKRDQQTFDSFIGQNVREIYLVFGKAETEQISDELTILRYRKKEVEGMESAVNNYKLFIYFNRVDFIIKAEHCIDWKGFKECSCGKPNKN